MDANGYRPTMNLRWFVDWVPRGTRLILQQEWVSDQQGHPPEWRVLPFYKPAEGEEVPFSFFDGVQSGLYT